LSTDVSGVDAIRRSDTTGYTAPRHHHHQQQQQQQQ